MIHQVAKPNLLPGAPAERAELAETVRARALERARAGGNPRIFGDGETAFAEILQLIESARERIDVRAFLWRDDECGNRLAKALVEAANRGVRVSIDKDRIAAVYEYTGGNKQSFFHKRVLPDQGIQAWFLSRVYRAPGSFRQRRNPLAEELVHHENVTARFRHKRFDHSKLFIFDDETLVLGSMGIGDNHHSDWVDVMVEIQGAQHVKRLRDRLAEQAEFSPNRRIDFLVHNREVHAPRTCPMADERLALIEAAESSLLVEMAYLGDRRFTSALLRIIRRGVQVTLITSRADVLGNLNLATCDTLLRRSGAPANLTIVILPRIVHSKFVVVDSYYTDIGSANFTPLSHGVYDEINTHIADRDFAQRLEAVALAHCMEGRILGQRVAYRRFASQMERAFVAYQSRKGG